MPGGPAGALLQRHGRTAHRQRKGRNMTAPLKHSDMTIVDVALENRAYDIVIVRGALASLGARIAALRPGVRTAVVTDKTVARHWLEAAEASLAGAGIPTSRIIVEEG